MKIKLRNNGATIYSGAPTSVDEFLQTFTPIDDNGDIIEDAWIPSKEEVFISYSLEEIRSIRNTLLKESDWIVTKSLETEQGVPLEWKTYRQQLRDITNNIDLSAEVTFPIKPDLE
mgnify:CR=1 FL=1